MRSFRPLFQIVLLVLVACGGSDEDPGAQAAPGRLVVARCTAPPTVPDMRSFHVEATAQDTLGIAYVELTFDGQRRVWPGGGKRFVRINTDLTPTRPGRFPVAVVAVGIDGARGGAMRASVDVTDEPERLGPSIESHVLMQRVASWEREGFTKDERYPRGPTYGPAIPPELVPIHDPWWLAWMEADGAQPFLWAEHCPDVTAVTTQGEVLRCWLALHPKVADSLVWVGIHPSAAATYAMAYPGWTPQMKEDLDQAFYFAWSWLQSSLKTPGGSAPDPPISQLPATAETADVALNHQQAWVLYLATVAHSLALEIGGFVPWSILSYYPDDLRVLFDSREMFEAEERTYGDGTHYIGHWMDRVVHALPRTTFRFFVDQDIVRPTHYETITQLLEWSGDHLFHYLAGSDDAIGKTKREVALMHWQYPGMSPVQRVLAGTVRDNWTGVEHWTGGCPGTCRVYVSILRALNIPAYWVQGWGNGDQPHLDGHHAPVFPTIGRTLSHGDDMLNWFQFRARVSPPPSTLSITRLFVPWATFVDWFYTYPDHNVGRQKQVEIPLDVLPDDILDLYCTDLQGSNKTFLDQTEVYARFSEHYSVLDLLARSLWARLAQKEALLHYCK